MLSYVLSFYNDLFMYLDTTVHSMTLEQRYHFLLQCAEVTKAKGIYTDREYCEKELNITNGDFINGRFLIHAMDYWVLSFLYVVECEGDT